MDDTIIIYHSRCISKGCPECWDFVNGESLDSVVVVLCGSYPNICLDNTLKNT